MNATKESLAARLLSNPTKEDINQEDVARILSLLASKDDEQWDDSSQCAERIKRLQERHQALIASEDFKPGDIVCWKDGFKNRKRPFYGEPAIVIEVLADSVFDNTDDAGSPYFREPLTIVLGLVSDEDFIMFHYDGRRFEKSNING